MQFAVTLEKHEGQTNANEGKTQEPIDQTKDRKKVVRTQNHSIISLDFISWKKVVLHKIRLHSINLNFGYTMVCA